MAQKVIIDTDPGVDDTLALLLALSSPEIEILAISLCFGNCGLEACRINILKLWASLENHLLSHPEDRPRFPNFVTDKIPPIDGSATRKKPFLALGAEQPLQGELHTAGYFHGRDGLADITIRHPEIELPSSSSSFFADLPPIAQTSSSLLVHLVKENPPKSISLLTLGPLTNVAKAIEDDAETIGKLRRVVTMGGALDVPGNTSPSAEFNFFADPFAVKVVVDFALQPSRMDLVLLPLDITSNHTLPISTYKSLVDPSFSATPKDPSIYHNEEKGIKENKSWLIHFTSSVLEKVSETMKELTGLEVITELHDPSVVWWAANGFEEEKKGWKIERRVFEVERYGEHTAGMLVIDRRRGWTSLKTSQNRAKDFDSKLHLDPALTGVETSEQAHHLLELEASGEGKGEGHEEFEGARKGIKVLVGSPGQEVILNQLIGRIWGKQV